MICHMNLPWILVDFIIYMIELKHEWPLERLLYNNQDKATCHENQALRSLPWKIQKSILHDTNPLETIRCLRELHQEYAPLLDQTLALDFLFPGDLTEFILVEIILQSTNLFSTGTLTWLPLETSPWETFPYSSSHGNQNIELSFVVKIIEGLDWWSGLQTSLVRQTDRIVLPVLGDLLKLVPVSRSQRFLCSLLHPSHPVSVIAFCFEQMSQNIICPDAHISRALLRFLVQCSQMMETQSQQMDLDDSVSVGQLSVHSKEDIGLLFQWESFFWFVHGDKSLDYYGHVVPGDIQQIPIRLEQLGEPHEFTLSPEHGHRWIHLADCLRNQMEHGIAGPAQAVSLLQETVCQAQMNRGQSGSTAHSLYTEILDAESALSWLHRLFASNYHGEAMECLFVSGAVEYYPWEAYVTCVSDGFSSTYPARGNVLSRMAQFLVQLREKGIGMTSWSQLLELWTAQYHQSTREERQDVLGQLLRTCDEGAWLFSSDDIEDYSLQLNSCCNQLVQSSLTNKEFLDQLDRLWLLNPFHTLSQLLDQALHHGDPQATLIAQLLAKFPALAQPLDNRYSLVHQAIQALFSRLAEGEGEESREHFLLVVDALLVSTKNKPSVLSLSSLLNHTVVPHLHRQAREEFQLLALQLVTRCAPRISSSVSVLDRRAAWQLLLNLGQLHDRRERIPFTILEWVKDALEGVITAITQLPDLSEHSILVPYYPYLSLPTRQLVFPCIESCHPSSSFPWPLDLQTVFQSRKLPTDDHLEEFLISLCHVARLSSYTAQQCKPVSLLIREGEAETTIFGSNETNRDLLPHLLVDVLSNSSSKEVLSLLHFLFEDVLRCLITLRVSLSGNVDPLHISFTKTSQYHSRVCALLSTLLGKMRDESPPSDTSDESEEPLSTVIMQLIVKFLQSVVEKDTSEGADRMWMYSEYLTGACQWMQGESSVSLHHWILFLGRKLKGVCQDLKGNDTVFSLEERISGACRAVEQLPPQSIPDQEVLLNDLQQLIPSTSAQ